MYIFLKKIINKSINKSINKIKNKVIKKNSNITTNNKLIKGTQYLIYNDLIIKELFKLDINKKNILNYNKNVFRNIKPISIYLFINKCIYKKFFKYE